MEGHYTYFDNIIPQAEDGLAVAFAGDYQKALVGVLAAVLFIFIGRLVVSSKVKSDLEGQVVPKQRISLFGLLDFFMDCFIQYHDSVAGKHNRKHVTFCAAIFFFLFFLNLLGLIPGMPAATTSVWINVAMAFVVFFYFNIWGAKEQGTVNYIKHFGGPIPALFLIMFPIEIFSTCLRVLTLNLRLYWNVTADHMILSIFTDLLYPPLAAPFYALGLFVAFMQAFVFATLTMIYTSLATDHGEDH